MNTKDLPIVIIGLAILYLAYLVQNGMLRTSFEGFQDSATLTMPPTDSIASMPAMPRVPPTPAMPMPPAPMPMPAAPMPAMNQGSTMSGMMPPTMPGMMPLKPNQAMLQEVSQKLNSITNQSQSLIAMVQQMQLAQNNAQEGFQSYQNPYNSPSPSNQQAYEFRLGKRSLVDEVLSTINR